MRLLRRAARWTVGAVLLLMTAPAAGGTTVPAEERALQLLAQGIAQAKRLLERFAPYEAVFRRDPLQPIVDDRGELISSIGLHSGYLVQGIIWSDAHPLVVIDDELFAQGDTVGPYTILRIAPDGITVQRAAEQLFIPLDRGLEAPREQVIPSDSANPPPTSSS